MYLHKTISALNCSQIAYPVGENKDSYNIKSWFVQDVETLAITDKHEVSRNIFSKEEILFTGTFKECQDFIVEVVEKEGEWTRDEKLNYVLLFIQNNL